MGNDVTVETPTDDLRHFGLKSCDVREREEGQMVDVQLCSSSFRKKRRPSKQLFLNSENTPLIRKPKVFHEATSVVKVASFVSDPKSNTLIIHDRCEDIEPKQSRPICKVESNKLKEKGSDRVYPYSQQACNVDKMPRVQQKEMFPAPSGFGELTGLDLSHLNAEERAVILEVAARAKQVEKAETQKVKNIQRQVNEYSNKNESLSSKKLPNPNPVSTTINNSNTKQSNLDVRKVENVNTNKKNIAVKSEDQAKSKAIGKQNEQSQNTNGTEKSTKQISNKFDKDNVHKSVKDLTDIVEKTTGACSLCLQPFDNNEAKNSQGKNDDKSDGKKCVSCGKITCKSCSVVSSILAKKGETLCKLCAKQRELAARSGAWLQKGNTHSNLMRSTSTDHNPSTTTKLNKSPGREASRTRSLSIGSTRSTNELLDQFYKDPKSKNASIQEEVIQNDEKTAIKNKSPFKNISDVKVVKQSNNLADSKNVKKSDPTSGKDLKLNDPRKEILITKTKVLDEPFTFDSKALSNLSTSNSQNKSNVQKTQSVIPVSNSTKDINVVALENKSFIGPMENKDYKIKNVKLKKNVVQESSSYFTKHVKDEKKIDKLSKDIIPEKSKTLSNITGNTSSYRKVLEEMESKIESEKNMVNQNKSRKNLDFDIGLNNNKTKPHTKIENNDELFTFDSKSQINQFKNPSNLNKKNCNITQATPTLTSNVSPTYAATSTTTPPQYKSITLSILPKIDQTTRVRNKPLPKVDEKVLESISESPITKNSKILHQDLSQLSKADNKETPYFEKSSMPTVDKKNSNTPLKTQVNDNDIKSNKSDQPFVNTNCSSVDIALKKKSGQVQVKKTNDENKSEIKSNSNVDVNNQDGDRRQKDGESYNGESEGPAEWSMDETDDNDTFFLVSSTQSDNKNLPKGITTASNLRSAISEDFGRSGDFVNDSEFYDLYDNENDTEGNFDRFFDDNLENESSYTSSGLKRLNHFSDLSMLPTFTEDQEFNPTTKNSNMHNKTGDNIQQKDIQNITRLKNVNTTFNKQDQNVTPINDAPIRNVTSQSSHAIPEIMLPGESFFKTTNCALDAFEIDSFDNKKELKPAPKSPFLNQITLFQYEEKRLSSNKIQPQTVPTIQIFSPSAHEASVGFTNPPFPTPNTSKTVSTQETKVTVFKPSTVNVKQMSNTFESKINNNVSLSEQITQPPVKTNFEPSSSTFPSNKIYAIHGSKYFEEDGEEEDGEDSDEDETLQLATSPVPVHPEHMEEMDSSKASSMFFRRTASTDNFEELLKKTTDTPRPRRFKPSLSGNMIKRTSSLVSNENTNQNSKTAMGRSVSLSPPNKDNLNFNIQKELSESKVDFFRRNSEPVIVNDPIQNNSNMKAIEQFSQDKFETCDSNKTRKVDTVAFVPQNRSTSFCGLSGYSNSTMTRCVSCGILAEGNEPQKTKTDLVLNKVVGVQSRGYQSKSLSVNSSTQVTPDRESAPPISASIDLCQLTALIEALRGTRTESVTDTNAKKKPVPAPRNNIKSTSDAETTAMPITSEPGTRFNSKNKVDASTETSLTGEVIICPRDRVLYAQHYVKHSGDYYRVVNPSMIDAGIGTHEEHVHYPGFSLPRAYQRSYSEVDPRVSSQSFFPCVRQYSYQDEERLNYNHMLIGNPRKHTRYCMHDDFNHDREEEMYRREVFRNRHHGRSWPTHQPNEDVQSQYSPRFYSKKSLPMSPIDERYYEHPPRIDSYREYNEFSNHSPRRYPRLPSMNTIHRGYLENGYEEPRFNEIREGRPPRRENDLPRGDMHQHLNANFDLKRSASVPAVVARNTSLPPMPRSRHLEQDRDIGYNRDKDNFVRSEGPEIAPSIQQSAPYYEDRRDYSTTPSSGETSMMSGAFYPTSSPTSPSERTDNTSHRFDDVNSQRDSYSSLNIGEEKLPKEALSNLQSRQNRLPESTGVNYNTESVKRQLPQPPQAENSSWKSENSSGALRYPSYSNGQSGDVSFRKGVSRLRRTMEDLDQEEKELDMRLRYLELGRHGKSEAGSSLVSSHSLSYSTSSLLYGMDEDRNAFDCIKSSPAKKTQHATSHYNAPPQTSTIPRAHTNTVTSAEANVPSDSRRNYVIVNDVNQIASNTQQTTNEHNMFMPTKTRSDNHTSLRKTNRSSREEIRRDQSSNNKRQTSSHGNRSRSQSYDVQDGRMTKTPERAFERRQTAPHDMTLEPSRRHESRDARHHSREQVYDPRDSRSRRHDNRDSSSRSKSRDSRHEIHDSRSLSRDSRHEIHDSRSASRDQRHESHDSRHQSRDSRHVPLEDIQSHQRRKQRKENGSSDKVYHAYYAMTNPDDVAQSWNHVMQDEKYLNHVIDNGHTGPTQVNKEYPHRDLLKYEKQMKQHGTQIYYEPDCNRNEYVKTTPSSGARESYKELAALTALQVDNDGRVSSNYQMEVENECIDQSKSDDVRTVVSESEAYVMRRDENDWFEKPTRDNEDNQRRKWSSRN